MDKKKLILRLALILIGNTIYALSVVLFIMPNGLITGGTTGLALFMNHQFACQVSVFVAIWNAVMFIVGGIILGKSFAMTTLISTFYYPFILGVIERIFAGYTMTDDIILSTIFAGLMIGVGIGLVILAGASTGGMDIPPLALKKKFNIPVSVSMYLIDFVVLILQMTFTSTDKILYGIILVLIYTATLSKILNYGEDRVQVSEMKKA